MTTRPLLVLPAIAVAVGVAAGALSSRDDGPRPTGPVALAAASGIADGPTRLPRISPLQTPSTPRIVLRRRDPDGGADWAVRSFTARGFGGAGRMPCLQLGRIRGGRFGWIVPGQTRLLAQPLTAYGDVTACQQRGRNDPSVRLITLAAYPIAGRPRITGTLVWGTAGRTRSRLQVRFGGARLDARGTAPFVLFGARTARADDLSYTGTDGAGRRVHVADYAAASGPAGGHGLRIVARAADPRGGLPFGIAAGKADDGRPCVTHTGQVLDGRLGLPDLDYGTWRDTPYCPVDRAIPRSRPMQFGTAGGVVEPPHTEAARRARLIADALRLPAGRVLVYGRVHPDVVRVEIRSPDDTRTLLPGKDHVIITVFADQFPAGGSGTATAVFRDGTRRTMPLGLSF